MELDYDFEIQSVLPQILWQTSEPKELLDRVGIAYNMKANHVPAFSDPATVVALWRAPENVRATMLKAGWSILPYEGEVDPGKGRALIRLFRDIHAKHKTGAYHDAGARLAIWDLVRFTHQRTTGQDLGSNGKPICSQQAQHGMDDARPCCAFDLSKAIAAITSDPRNQPPAGSELP